MKYLTLDLLARTRSEDDDVAENAAEEWERACAEYNKHIEAIRPKLPKSLRMVLDNYCLHDAHLIDFGRYEDYPNDKESFFIAVQMDLPGGQGLWLRYGSVNQLKAVFHESLKGGSEMFWLYDEVDVVETVSPDGDRVPVYTHSILFSGGVELQFRFLDFELKRYENILASVKSRGRNGTPKQELQLV